MKNKPDNIEKLIAAKIQLCLEHAEVSNRFNALQNCALARFHKLEKELTEA